MSSKNPMRSDEGVSATSTSGLEYEVFLNFRGPDTRAGFTDYLYVTFTNAGIRVFRDDEELRKGENIRSNLLKAINQSKIAIPIFSKGYAASKWCLKELVQIMECKKANGLKVMPVFYDVTPSEVKNQTGDFGKVCELHEKYYDENIKDWRKALREVGELKGWDVQNDTRYGRKVNNVRGIKLRFKKGKKYNTLIEDFARLPNLKFLESFGYGCNCKKKWHERMKPNNFSKKSPVVFSKLRWLSWNYFPHNLNMSRFSFEDLVMLNLSGCGMTSSWSGWKRIKMANNLKVLNLSKCDKLVRTPDFSYHPKLERLDLSGCENLVEIDESMGRLEHLVIIDLRHCKRLSKLPKELRRTESLEELYLNSTAIVEIPNWPPMKRLRVLSCGGCGDLEKVSSLSLPANLTELSFSSTKITELPDSIGNLVNLRKLSLASCEGLKTLPECIGNLVSLTKLDLLYSGIVVHHNAKLPQSLMSLKLMCQETQIPDLSSLINLKILELRTPYGGDCPSEAHDAALTWIGKLTNLEDLTLGLGYTVSIPKLPTSLKYLRISDCYSLGTLPHLPSILTRLDLSNCKALTSFEIGSCKSLKDLDICDWDLSKIDGLEMLENLTRLRIGSCVKLERLPDLSNLKMLKHLKVLSCPNLRTVSHLPSSLTTLEIWDCEALTSFEIGSCKSLKDLKIWACKALTSFEIGSCKSLEVLDICDCDLSKIDGLEMLENLTTLRIVSCVKLERLPDLSNLKMLKHLEVSDCPNLIEIPGWLESLDECIFLRCKSLERIPDIPKTEAVGAYFRISGCKKLKKVV